MESYFSSGINSAIKESSEDDSYRHVRASSVSNDRPSQQNLDTTDSSFSTNVSFKDDPKLESLSNELAARAPSWADTQEKKTLKKFNDKLIKRYNFVYELVTTEISHLKNLIVLRTVFRDVILSSKCMDTNTVNSLFPHLDTMEQLHSAFLADLRQCDPSQEANPKNLTLSNIGGTINKHLSNDQWLFVYGDFCSQHKISLQKKLMKLNLKNPYFSNILKECERSTQAGRKTLQDYYLVVTQRLSKYKSLIPQIKELARVPPEEPDIGEACDTLDNLMTAVNSKVEEYENSHTHKMVMNGLHAPGSEVSLEFLKNRQVVHSGSLCLTIRETGKTVNCFLLLLNDSLVFLQESSNSGGFRYTSSSISPLKSVVLFSESNPIVREDDSAKSKVNFFLIVSLPNPSMYTLTCHSFEERTKWINKINQVRVWNPSTDTRSIEDEKKLKIQIKTANELLTALDAKDREILSLINAKNQIWQQLLNVWNCSTEDLSQQTINSTTSKEEWKSTVSLGGGDSTEDISLNNTEPEELCNYALQAIGKLRLLMHSGTPLPSVSLTRSASNAEEKTEPTSAVSLPKRAETFSGYDRFPDPTTPTPTDSEDTSNRLLIQEATGITPTDSSSKNSLSGSGSNTKEKTRRTSVSTNIFNIFSRSKDRNSVSEESGSEPELRAPEGSCLLTLNKLHYVMENMIKTVNNQRTKMATLVIQEQEQKERVKMLTEKTTDSPRQMITGTNLEKIRLERAELEKEKAKFRDETNKEKARLESRKEHLDHLDELMRQKEELHNAEMQNKIKESEEKLRLKQEELTKQEMNLQEEKRRLQIQVDKYHRKSSHVIEESPPATPGAQLVMPLVTHAKSFSSEKNVVSNPLNFDLSSLVTSKSQSKSTSNLHHVNLPVHLASKINEDKYCSTPGLETKASLPLHLASEAKKNKKKLLPKPLNIKLPSKNSNSGNS